MKRSRARILVVSILSLALVSCGSFESGISDPGQSETPLIHATKLTLNATEVTLYAGETFQIEHQVIPNNALEQEVAYEVKNSSVCDVSDTGLITAKQYSGLTTVKVYLKDRPAIYGEIRVISRRRTLVEEISCSVNSLSFDYIGQTKSFTYSVLPINADDKSVDIYIEDPSIAQLNEDKNEVTALKNGSTNLVIKSLESGSNVENVIPITVNEENTQEITVDPSLDPTKYLTYKELVGITNEDILTSTATKDNPANVLVVPVEFSDYTFDDVFDVENGEEVIKEKLEAAFNGTVEDTNYWESVGSYFEKSSFGNLNLNFDVTDVVSLNLTTSQILDGTYNVGSAVYSAFYTMKSNNSDLDFTKYDYDKDGLMDSVWFIYSAPDYQTDSNFYDENGTFWAYVTCFQSFSPNVSSPNICTFAWASYDFMDAKGTNKIDAHTYIHETGHLLGLNDYYDYTSTSEPLGMYDMQDCNVGDHNVWTKTAFGWIDPIIVDASSNKFPAKVHLNLRENGGAIFITDDYSGSAFDEYLVLELYTPNGLNELDSTYAYNSAYGKMPKDYGVKLYHVDSRLISAIENNRQVYFESEELKNGIPIDMTILIAASNTESYDRNYTVELFDQIRLISSKVNGGTYLNRMYPFTSEDLFETGDTFDLKTYRNQTYNRSGKLNSGEELNLKLRFTSVTEDGADIIIDYLE